MNTEQAFLTGFVKRANEYGLSEKETAALLKSGGALNELAALRNSGFAHAPEMAEQIANWRNSTAAGVRKLRSPEGKAELSRTYDKVKGQGYMPLNSHLTEKLPRFRPSENGSEFLSDIGRHHAADPESRELVERFIQTSKHGPHDEAYMQLNKDVDPILKDISRRIQEGPLKGLVNQAEPSHFSALAPQSTHSRLLERLNNSVRQ